MIDREKFQPGYFKSTWPVECGGNRRQKSSKGRLNAENAVAEVQTVSSDKWNVMVIKRDAGEFYLGGTMPYFFGPEPYGWVQKFDPITLETLSESPKLPCGDTFGVEQLLHTKMETLLKLTEIICTHWIEIAEL